MTKLVGEAEYRLDEGSQCLWRGARRIDLKPKAYEVLRCLCRCAGQLVTKQALLDAVWPDTHVSEAVLTVAVAQLREALGDDARRPRCIETAHRRGYRWIGQIAIVGETPEPESSHDLDDAAARTVFGRSEAVAALRRAYALAEAGRRQLVFVTGEPGIGKTALVDAFCAGVDGRAAAMEARDPRGGSSAAPLLGRGQCLEQYGPGEPYMPVLEAMESLCGDAEVQRVLRSHAPAWLVQLPGVASGDERADLLRTLAGSTSERMIRELSSALAVLARERPFVLVFEDMHWSDPATVALLAALAQRRAPARLLLVATYRSVDAILAQHPIVALTRELAAKRQCLEIPLEGLDAKAVGDYLRWRFPRGAFAADVCEVLQAQTTGNPLFLQAAVDDFVQEGWLREENGSWTCAVSPDTIRDAVPPAVRDMIEHRFERLPAGARETLEVSSLVGMVFSSQTTAAALGGDTAEIEDLCTRLARSGQFIEAARSSPWPDGSSAASFAFRHVLYRQVLAARVPPARRATLHLRIAERLEAGYGARASEIASQLALHFERGGDVLRAARQCHEAARMTLRRYATAEAMGWLRRGLALLEGAPSGSPRHEIELRLRGALIGPLMESEGIGAAELPLLASRVGELARGDVATFEAMQALGGLVAFHVGCGRPDRAADAVREQMRRLDAEPALRGAEPVVRYLEGYVELARGRYESAVENLTPALQLPPLVPGAPVAFHLAAAADIAFARLALGFPDQALRAFRDLCARSEALGHPYTEFYVLARQQRVAGLTFEGGVAAEGAAKIRALAHLTGHRNWRNLATMAEATELLAHGEGALAVRRLRKDPGIAPDAGSVWKAMLANALLLTGRLDEARTAIDEAAAYIARCGGHWHAPEVLRLGAEIDRALGRNGDAERGFNGAIDVAREQKAKWLELKAATGLARLWREQGRRIAARDLLSGIYGWFGEGFELLDVRTARALRDDLEKL
ncbi:AAA family ATPase [bacterium]|nr:AAA family ATPase [bacterium]